MKTINRGWLKRQIEKGNIEARCAFHFTDDYAFDNATGFGKTDWMLSRVRYPQFDPESHRCINDDRKPDMINFDESDFRTKSGSAYRNDDGTITLRIHSNEVWKLRMTEA